MRTAVSAIVTCIALAAAPALAQDEPKVVALTGTLAKVHATRSVTIAYRDASIPFSYLSARGEPIGYSIELCRKLVEAMSETVGHPLDVKWLPVTSETRIDAVVSGRADLECGSTTDNVERKRTVAFSPTIFVSGTKLMVRRGSAIRSYRDLQGKTVVVTAGTTNELAMREIARRFKVDFKLVAARDHAESFAMVAEGKADAFATDDVLLHGLIAQHGASGKLLVVGEFLSYDPYGIMYRKGDAQMKDLVEATFRQLADNGDLAAEYRRWFLMKLPSGARMDLPMSAQLEEIFRALGVRPE